MKKILLFISLLVGLVCSGQLPTVPGTQPRSLPANRPQDYNLWVRNQLGLPQFNDTTQANANTNLDTCGRVIYTYDVDNFWIRKCFPVKHWEVIRSGIVLPSTITIINDSSIQICNSNGVCDTFITNLAAPVVTNVTTINDSTILICVNGSCDTVITHITFNPPITSTTILNDSTLIICNVNGCDTFVIHTTINPPLNSTTILNDSTIIVCNTNGCDTFVVHTVINPAITTTTILNDSTIIVCNTNGCDTLVINITPPIISTTVLNDTTIIVCNNSSCDTIVIHPPINSTTIINDSTIVVCSNTGCDTLVVRPPITTTTILTDTSIIVCTPLGCDTLVINPPITTTTILNDSTIIICGTNSCDTVILNSPITNVTVLSDTTIQVCGAPTLGAEQITNGDFAGSATGWNLGTLWAYGSNNIVHSFGSTDSAAQSGTLIEGGSYIVSANIGGTIGTLNVKLDGGTAQTFTAGTGPVTFTGTWNSSTSQKIVLTPSSNFDGFVTSVSVRQILTNCDTLHIPPTVFIPSDTFYVKNTLYSTGVGVTNHDTVYSSLASRVDSGHLSIVDWVYFNHKVDSLYYHPSVAGQDSFMYSNGDTSNILWYVNDVNANGLISGGQVLPSGTPYVFNVTPAVYRINGVRYTSPATQITIDSADLSLPRTDRFVVDTSGNAAVITGVPANPNLAPSFDVAWQLSLTTVDLPAANPPTITDSLIWNENVAPEWIPVTNTGTTTNPNNTVFPWLGLKSIDVTNINNSDIIKFTHTGSFDLTPFVVANGSVTGFIRLKAPMPSTAALRGNWLNAGTSVSPVTIIPIDRNNTTSYQGFSVPLSAFALVGNTVTDFWITYTNTSATNYAGFYLDDINLQSGIQPPVPVGNALINVFRKPTTDSVFGTYQNGAVAFQFRDTTVLSGITAGNGITDSVNRIILGGTVYKTTTLTVLNGLNININGNQGFANPILKVTNSSASAAPWGFQSQVSGTGGNAISGSTSNGGIAIIGTGGLGGTGISGNTTTGIGVAGASSDGSGHAFAFGKSLLNGVNDITNVGYFYYTNTPAADGIGISLNFLLSGVSTGDTSNQIISKWTNATNHTSQFYLTGMNAGSRNTLFTLSGSGAVQFNKYGIGTFTGTPTFGISVDASGNLIETGLGSAITAANGLTDSANRIIMGGTFYKNTSIANAGFTLSFSGVNTGTSLISANNTGTGFSANGISATVTAGSAFVGNATSGVGVLGQATSGAAAFFSSTSGTGALIQSSTGGGAQITSSSTTSYPLVAQNTNTVVNAVSAGIGIYKQPPSGTPVAGIGISIDYIVAVDNLTTPLSNQIISKWTDPVLATRTSQLSFTGVNSAVTQTLMTMDGNGIITALGTGSPNPYTFRSINTTQIAVKGEATTGTGVNGTASSSGTGVVGSSGSGSGGTFQSNTGIALITSGVLGAQISAFDGTNLATTTEIANFARSTSASTPLNGAGGFINLKTQTTTGALQISNQLIWSWTDATNATRTSQFSITGVNNAVTQTLVTIDGNGTATFLGPSSPTNTVRGINTTGVAIDGESTSGTGVQGIATTGIAGNFGNNTASNTALNSNNSGGGYASIFTTSASSTNSVLPITNVNRLTTGTAADGIGGSFVFGVSTTVQNQVSNSIISKWTTAADATRTSQLVITGVTSAATQDWLTIGQSGYVKFRPMTVTEAGAIATAEGLTVFVSNTDATFTSIGLWIFQNGAWHAL